MEYKDYPFTLGMKENIFNSIQPKQGETAVRLLVTLTDNGQLYDLTDTTVKAIFVKPDRTVSSLDCNIENAAEGAISTVLTNQILAVPGRVNCEIQITGDKGLAKSWTFTMLVQKSIGTAEIESSNELAMLDKALLDTTIATDRVETLETEIQQAEAQRVEESNNRANEFQTLKTDAVNATEEAINKANLANEKATLANTNALLAGEKATLAESKANLAQEKADLAVVATTNANTATNNANNAANSANLAATLANEKATLASSAINSISTLENEVTQAENLRKQNETSRQDAEANRVLSFNSYDEKIIKLEEAKVKKYGARRVLNADTPILERLGDAVGLVANAGVGAGTVVNNFDSIYPWSHIRNCIRTSTGRIVYQGEPGYELTVGDWLVEIPKFYLNIVQTETHRDTWISEYPIGGFVLPNSFKKEDGTVLNKIYVPRFKLGIVDGVAVSRPGLVPATVRTLDQFRTLALAKGPGWQLTDMMLVGEIIHPLYMVEFAHLNSQLILGSGITSMRYTATDLAQLTALATNKVVLLNASADRYAVGQIIGIGTSQGGNQIAREREILAINTVDASTKELVFDGDPVNITAGNMVYNVAQKTGGSLTIKASSGRVDGVNGKSSVKYRNMEDIFMGNVFEWIDGMLINDHSPHLCTKPSKYSSSITSDYVPLSYTSGNTDGYVRELGIDTNFPFAQLPISVGAGTSTGYCDYYYRNTGLRAPVLGGAFYIGSTAGLWYWHCHYSPASSPIRLGARLLYRG